MSSPFPFRTGYVLDYVTLVLCLMMELRILSFRLTLGILLSIARWIVSVFFTNVFERDHVWHPYAIAGKTHWLKDLSFWTHGMVPVQKDFSVRSKNSPSCFYSHQNFWFCSVFNCYCLSQIFIFMSPCLFLSRLFVCCLLCQFLS